jgi:hypothetical protein
MKKVRKFEEGGYTGDDEIVKYRMGMIDANGNDITKKSSKPTAEPDVEPTVKTETKQGEHAKIDRDTREQALYENAPRFISKGFNKKSINPDRMVRKDILNEFPKSKAGVVAYDENPEYLHAGYKKGGTVKSVKTKSASARADGCAVKGKTKGTMILMCGGGKM